MSHIVRQEKMPPGHAQMHLGMDMHYAERVHLGHAEVFFEMRDARTRKVLVWWNRPNVITKDAGIIAARLHRNSLEPTATKNNGLTMLVVGTGATGNLLNPDAPQQTQRKLNNEIGRKAFSSSQFRNSSGVAVAFPTNIVDFTATFGEGEAVGPLNEMALISAFSSNPTVVNPVNDGPDTYDATIDTTQLDLLSNYLTFSVVSKPSTATVAITWRYTFGP